MWIQNLNPTLFKFGFLEIRWYGLVYVLGFFLSVYWMKYLIKEDKLNLTNDDVWDLLFYLMLGVLVGSRLFMIFWQPDIYLLKPWNLFKIWEGGMSFHGGFVGIVTAAYLYCKKKKLNLWTIADVLAVPTMLALALGRVANFINGELVGRIWSGKWCVVFPDYGNECRHPSTLYAASKRFLVFFYLLWLTFKKQFKHGQVTEISNQILTSFKPGFIFWNFVFWEGLGRIIVDFYREDTLYYSFSIGQWFSLAMVIVAILIFNKNYKQDWKKLF